MTCDNWDPVKNFIEKHHEYEVPCIMKLATAEANQSYENWIHEQIFTPKL